MESIQELKRELAANCLDGRTKHAILLKKIWLALESDTEQAKRTAIKASVAFNLLCEKKLIDDLLNKGNLLDDEGHLLPAIRKDLLKLRQDTIKLYKLLDPTTKQDSKDDLEDLLNE